MTWLRLGMGHVLEALPEQKRPVTDAAIHDTGVNEIKAIGRIKPRLLGVIHLELVRPGIVSEGAVAASSKDAESRTLTLGGTLRRNVSSNSRKNWTVQNAYHFGWMGLRSVPMT